MDMHAFRALLTPAGQEVLRAAEALSLFRPDVVIPIHWGTFAPLGLRSKLWRQRHLPVAEFERLAEGASPATEVRVLEPGEKTDYP